MSGSRAHGQYGLVGGGWGQNRAEIAQKQGQRDPKKASQPRSNRGICTMETAIRDSL